MNNGKPNPLDGLDQFLAGMYEILKRHEQRLFELTNQVETGVVILKSKDLDFALAFDEAYGQATRAAAEAHAHQLRSLDEIISRLRGI